MFPKFSLINFLQRVLKKSLSFVNDVFVSNDSELVLLTVNQRAMFNSTAGNHGLSLAGQFINLKYICLPDNHILVLIRNTSRQFVLFLNLVSLGRLRGIILP